VNKISTLVCAAMIPCLAQAASIPYTDNFNADTPGLGTTPGTDVPAGGWSISNGGSVDIVASGPSYGITCRGGTGNCIDLNGTTGNPGDLVSPGLSLTGGQTYTAQFVLSGNQRITQTDKVTVDFGTDVASFSVTKNDPFTVDSLTFTPTTTGTYNLSFLDTSMNPSFPSDNIGAILDNVKVQVVPLPAAAWLLLSGLAGMGLMARRRSAA
jgi:hypothetical protein